MSNATPPLVNLDNWDELDAHHSFAARYDFRNESRWNGDGDRYRTLLTDLDRATEWVRWYPHPGYSTERETLAYYADSVHPYLYIYELDPFGPMPVVKIYLVDAVYASALLTRHAPRHLADFMLE